MNASRSCLPPVKKLHLRCTSASSGGTIRILTVVYLSWTSFACLIDPPVKWDHWLFPLIVGEVTALKCCFLSQHSLQSRSRTRAAKRFGLPVVQIYIKGVNTHENMMLHLLYCFSVSRKATWSCKLLRSTFWIQPNTFFYSFQFFLNPIKKKPAFQTSYKTLEWHWRKVCCQSQEIEKHFLGAE